ncbi:DUF6011 domain-containing protein [Streptomyces sp. NPDC088115]|uniref:DUF6011 domain-containing protein n=1 Tax=Streptomyces sp. NPDC088115 TaxID=3365824 RepID=UPI0038265AAC
MTVIVDQPFDRPLDQPETDPMTRNNPPQQQALTGPPDGGYRHRYCRRCGKPLTAPESRRRGYGEHCDPTRQPQPAPARDIDQDAIPGT